ncbi:hypothetical protein D9M70_574990 [compost metagenome]
MRPLIAGQRQQVLVVGDAFGGDADIGLVMQQHVCDLCRVALLDRQPDLGVALGELADHPWQRITCLRMGGGNGEVALVLCGIVHADPLQALDLLQDLLNRGENAPPRFGQAADALAVPGEDIDTQLFLQLDDGLGHAGL